MIGEPEPANHTVYELGARVVDPTHSLDALVCAQRAQRLVRLVRLLSRAFVQGVHGGGSEGRSIHHASRLRHVGAVRVWSVDGGPGGSVASRQRGSVVA